MFVLCSFSMSFAFHDFVSFFVNLFIIVLSSFKKIITFSFFLPVRAIKGVEDVTIRVSDQGGGIPRRMTDTLFEYLYTTAPTPAITSSTELPPGKQNHSFNSAELRPNLCF